MKEQEYKNSTTELRDAIRSNDMEQVKLLVSTIKDTNAKDIYGGCETPLRIAIINNNIEAVKLLIKAGADVNYIRRDNGCTYLVEAIGTDNHFKRINIEIMKLLLEAGINNITGFSRYKFFRLLR
jgi:ankyrin repeat protein